MIPGSFHRNPELGGVRTYTSVQGSTGLAGFMLHGARCFTKICRMHGTYMRVQGFKGLTGLMGQAASPRYVSIDLV